MRLISKLGMAAVAIATISLLASAAWAKQEVKTEVKLTSAANVASSADPGYCTPAPCPKCCPRCISYKHHWTLRKTCCCCETKEVVLQVYDPCCCCCIDVPVCVPACCCNPCASSRGGLLVRGVTTYCFDCGYKVRIVMGPRGNLVVHTYGR